jgi:hypothetical protein
MLTLSPLDRRLTIGGGKQGAAMRRTILLASVLPFVSAFLGGALAFSLVAAPQATAQSSQLQEVRASAFTLVGEDGTVLAQLAPAPNGRAGRLSLRTEGTERVTLVGTGILNVYDQDGTTVVFRAGRSYTVGATTGLPPTNGVELGPGGSIGMLESR